MPDQDDPFAAIAKPIENADPFAAIAKPASGESAAATPPQPTLGQEVWGRAKSQLTGAAEGAANTVGSTVSGIARGIHAIPYVGETLAPQAGINALEARTKERSTPANSDESTGKTAEQIAEWMIPSGAEEKAGQLAVEHLPQIARFAKPAARIATSALESGLRNTSQGGDFRTGAEIGAGAGAVGEAAAAAAPKVAETALGVGNRMRGHGRTIGESVLNETRGIRPETIAKEASGKLRGLTNNLESAAANATATGIKGDTSVAHTVLDDAISKAPRNAPSYKAKLESLRSMLELNPGTGAQNRVYTPEEILELKRGIDKEIGSWDHAAKLSVDPVKRQLYRALDAELDRTVPEASQLNQRISSLIPVKQRAEQLTRNAGLGQRIAHRMAAHTGALAGAGIGGGIGYERGGLPGAVVGGTMGIAVPEMLSSPTTRMAVARGLKSSVPVRGVRGIAAQIARPSVADEEEKTNEEK